MHVSELWRYPVKSMAGERLQQAEVARDGIVGDRLALVVRDGRVITSRTHPKLLLHHALLGENGEPLVDGHPWTSQEAAQAGSSRRVGSAIDPPAQRWL